MILTMRGRLRTGTGVLKYGFVSGLINGGGANGNFTVSNRKFMTRRMTMLMKQYVDEKHLAAVHGQCDVIKVLVDSDDTTHDDLLKAIFTLRNIAASLQMEAVIRMNRDGYILNLNQIHEYLR
jgi:hypothetical protein